MLERIRDTLKRPIVRYITAVGAVGAALFLREILTAGLGPDFPEYLLFYPTVMIVALLAGLWPALVANVTAAALIFLVWSVPGRPPLLHIGTSNYVGLVMFMAVCAFLSFVAELYRRSRLKAAAYDKEQAERQTQEALRRQAEMLKLSFDAIIVWRLGGVIESWNRGAEELYGYTEEEALGRGIDELLNAPTTPGPQAADSAPGPQAADSTSWREFEKSLQRAGEWFGEVQHVTKDGRQVVVSSRQLMGRGLDGTERVLEVDRDVTDEKRVEEELRRAHDELEEKVELRTSDLQRANRTLLMVSACDQALVQISDERELTGVICQIIQDEGGYPLVWVGLLNDGSGALRCVASAGDRDGYLETVSASWGDGALAGGPIVAAVRSNAPAVCDDIAGLDEGARWTEAALARGYRSVAALPLLNAQKQAFGALVIHSEKKSGFEPRQVTLLKELADDLAFGITSLRARAERDQAQRALELKATQLQALAGEIVRTEQRERQRIAQLLHDQIQQLLVATLYGLEGLSEPRPVSEYRESAKGMSGLVRECITVSRSLASELSHPAFTEPDLCTALGWLGTWTLEKHGVRVTVNCEGPITAEVEETRVSLLQAVRELLFNVVKHAGVREARVDLARTAEGHISVCVSDSGVGFEPGSALVPGQSAGGIGLLSMRERLDVIGGGMKVESAIGSGSRVTVWVPADRKSSTPPAIVAPKGRSSRRPSEGAPDATPGAARGTALPRGASGRIRVLLVDDHAVVRNGIALQLQQQPDIEVIGEAADGRDAVEMVRSLRPDVVTMDVNMPGMNGVDAAKAIRAQFPETRIIGLSTSGESEQGAAMRNAGAEHYLSKSESLDKLLAAIRGPSDRE